MSLLCSISMQFGVKPQDCRNSRVPSSSTENKMGNHSGSTLFQWMGPSADEITIVTPQQQTLEINSKRRRKLICVEFASGE